MIRFLEKNLIWIMVGLGVVLLAAVIYSITTSMPPHSFTMLTGREGGAYYNTALQYQKLAQQYGFDMKIVPTAGSVQALQMLEEGKGDAAFIQGGIGLQGDPNKLNTLASVFYEPVWIFYRKALAQDKPLETIPELTGKRFGIGEVGSGTNDLARLMLTDAGIDANNSQLLELSSTDAAAKLRSGDLDVAFFVSAPTAKLIQDLSADPNIAMLSLRRADAFARRHRFLTRLTLPEGTVDLTKNLPPNDVQLVSTVANLVVRKNFHPDLLRLLTIAAVQTHERGGMFEDRFEFPNLKFADLPVGKEELAYLNRIKNGESTSDNYLPFQWAALLDRFLLFVVPLLLIVLPLLGRSPLLYQTYQRYRINRWYKQVRSAELRVESTASADIDEEIHKLRELDDKLVVELSVGSSYMPDVYNLRTNIQFVINKLERRRQQLQGLAPTGAPTPGNGEAIPLPGLGM